LCYDELEVLGYGTQWSTFIAEREDRMKRALVTLLVLGGTLVPTGAFAGWGAIACDVKGSGACGVSYGWGSLAKAEGEAILYCQAGGYTCYIYNWEHNECIYGPSGSYTCN
jgi:hypothetical protein